MDEAEYEQSLKSLDSERRRAEQRLLKELEGRAEALLAEKMPEQPLERVVDRIETESVLGDLGYASRREASFRSELAAEGQRQEAARAAAKAEADRLERHTERPRAGGFRLGGYGE